MHDCRYCGGRRNATKIAVLERDFRAAIFDCVFPETLSDDIHKRLVFVDMTPCVAFGKCFAKMASVRILQSLSNFKFTGAIYIISLTKLQEKFSTKKTRRSEPTKIYGVTTKFIFMSAGRDAAKTESFSEPRTRVRFNVLEPSKFFAEASTFTLQSSTHAGKR